MNKLFFSMGLVIVALAATNVFADDNMQNSQGGQMNNQQMQPSSDPSMSQDQNAPAAQQSDMSAPGQDTSGAGTTQQTQGGY